MEGLALERPPLPLSSIHRQVTHFAQLIGEAAPSYWVVRDIALGIPKDLQTLAQHGPRRFSELYDLVHRRDASAPNAVWQADHAQLDILLLREDGPPARPWLTAVIDDYSRAIAGYYLGFLVNAERYTDGRFALNFREGRTSEADVVIGADGAWSEVRRYLTPVDPIIPG